MSELTPARARAKERNLDWPRRVHLLGAGGAGVSGIARLLAHRGVRVSGHDRATSKLLESLVAAGVPVTVGESRASDLPADAQLVVRSAAVADDDPQVAAARERGLPVRRYAEALAGVCPPGRTLAVAGTHGKTTTSWMLWHALEGIGEELRGPLPGGLIGGLDQRLGTNALAGGDGGWFAVEACEYDRTFLRLAPAGAAITNVESDHLDYYGTLAAIEEAFARFCGLVADDGLIVRGRDVPDVVGNGVRAERWTLGREFDVDLVGEERGCFVVRLRGPGWATPPAKLGVPGHANVENAALALALAVGTAVRAGADPARASVGAARGIERFGGVERRFETWGSEGDVVVVHDYAHHPTEVRVTLEAARRVHPGHALHVLFQPHQHSRTSRFLEDFAHALRSADRVVVTDVYGARKHVDGERFAGAPELVQRLSSMRVDAAAGGPLGSAVERFTSGLEGSVCALVLGAGDVEEVRDELFGRLAVRGPARRGSVR